VPERDSDFSSLGLTRTCYIAFIEKIDQQKYQNEGSEHGREPKQNGRSAPLSSGECSAGEPIPDAESSHNPGTIGLPAYWENPDPLYYFDRWDLSPLPSDALKRIQARLLKVHADFLDNKAGDIPEIECWRRAYDIFAREFARARKSEEGVLTGRIPAMVADAGTSGRWKWGRNGLDQAFGQYNERLGSGWYSSGYIRRFLRILEGRIAEWRGKLILQSIDTTAQRPKRRGRPSDIDNSNKVARLVEELGSDWLTKPMELAGRMDTLELPIDPRWRKEGVDTWVDKMEMDPPNFIRLIRDRLKGTKK
jgi:hypothetical protein